VFAIVGGGKIMTKEEFEKWANDNHWLLVDDDNSARSRQETARSFGLEIKCYVWITPSGKRMTVVVNEDGNVNISET
jgi:hypothetical protein